MMKTAAHSQDLPCRRCSGRALGRATRRLVAWGAPAALIALLPKCPACLAAYIALGTGVWLSLPAAATLRWGLLILAGAALAILLGKTFLNLKNHQKKP